MKRLTALLLILVMVTAICSTTVSASCPDHGTRYISYWCTGTLLQPQDNDSGFNCTLGHGSYCIVTRYRCYTGELCTLGSCDWVYSRASYHFCIYAHSLGNNVDVCPY